MKYPNIISSEPDTVRTYLHKIIRYRYIISPLIKKEFKLKFSQTWLGIGWTLITPVVTVTLYSFFFGYIFNMPWEESPYILYVLSGFFCWNLFNQIAVQSGITLVNNHEIIRKIACPKILLHIAKTTGVSLELLPLWVLVLAGTFLFQGITLKILMMPLIIAGLIIFSFSVSLLLSALTIIRRDLHHSFPLVMQLGIWFTPVFYPINIIPDRYKFLLYLNPVSSFIDLFRWSVNIQTQLSPYIYIGLVITFVTFFVSLYIFKQKEDHIIDYM